MARRTKKRNNNKQQLRLYQSGSGATTAAPLGSSNTKRRLPRPATAAHGLPPVGDISPAAETIAAYAREAAVAQSLTVYSLFNDWAAMLEATLERWAINQRSLLLTGQVAPDPPEVAAVFSRVRDRRDTAAQQNPGVARMLEHHWLNTFALLTEAAQLGLWEFYAGQPIVHPDVIGQAFLVAIDGDAAWARHFPAWAAAIGLAQSLLPDPDELTLNSLVDAAHAARQDGASISLHPPTTLPEFQDWYAVLESYLRPLVLGSPLTDNSALTLAAAAQFTPFLVKRGKVLFQFPANQQPPLLLRLQRINAMLYRLNGYLMEHLNAMIAAEQELRQQITNPPPIVADEPDPTLIWGQGEELAYESAI